MSTTSAVKRRQLSPKTRFEVFKRDGFTCQYCGGHPPAALLHVDHINPVANGGTNSSDNLITSCSKCNFGKAAKLLSSIPQSLEDKAKEVRERERQIKGYSDTMEAYRNRLEKDAWRVAHVFDEEAETRGFRKDWLSSIKRFIERLGLHEVIVSAERAVSKKPFSNSTAFKYFCGTCWRKIKESDAEIDAVRGIQ